MSSATANLHIIRNTFTLAYPSISRSKYRENSHFVELIWSQMIRKIFCNMKARSFNGNPALKIQQLIMTKSNHQTIFQIFNQSKNEEVLNKKYELSWHVTIEIAIISILDIYLRWAQDFQFSLSNQDFLVIALSIMRLLEHGR